MEGGGYFFFKMMTISLGFLSIDLHVVVIKPLHYQAKSKVVMTYLTLQSGSKVNQSHCPLELLWDIGKMQQMYRFGIDVMFRSGNFWGNKESQGKGHCTKVKSLESQNNSARYKYWAW